ncbi:hypothetical protein [Cupriavidus basilensis]|uniref:hypothetical protein n=1 Tax=Cupriavidus basilensis TaxID=68895 RepID=UPI001F511C00|nr:hypothetical protein [Cupriavidus basilensis]
MLSLCRSIGVFGPALLDALVVTMCAIVAGYDATAAKALVVTALKNYINAIGLGQTLTNSRWAHVVYDASPGVTSVTSAIGVTGVALNCGTADLAATVQQAIKRSSVSVA